jgi:hypothetical protein
MWRQALARVHVHRGELAEAERLAREAVGESERTNWLNDQCTALWDRRRFWPRRTAPTRQ